MYVRRYYNNKVRKAPHVVGHYAAGARLIGLTEREMAKRFATLSVGSKEADSPYAQPPVGIFRNKSKSYRMTGKIKLKINTSLRNPEPPEDAEPKNKEEERSLPEVCIPMGRLEAS